MTSHLSLLLSLATIAGPATGRPPRPTDLHGDPLPDGAVARLGTLRWCHADGCISCAAFSPDGRTVVTGSSGVAGGVRVWDRKTGRLLRYFQGYTRRDEADSCVEDLVVVPDGKSVIVAEIAGLVRELDLASGKELRRFAPSNSGSEMRLAVSPDACLLAAKGIESDVVLVWEVASGKPRHRLQANGPGLGQLAFSPDSSLLAATGSRTDGRLHVWDVRTGRLLQTAGDKESPGRCLAFLPDGKLVFNDTTRSLTLIDPTTGRTLRTYRAEGENDVEEFTVTADGTRLVAIGLKGTITVWDVSTSRRRHRVPDPVRGRPVLSPDGKTLAMAGPALHLWSLDAEGPRAVTTPLLDCTMVAFSPDGARLAVGGLAEPRPRIFDVTTGREQIRLGPLDGGCGLLVWSGDGRRLATAGVWGRCDILHLWDATTGQEAGTLSGERQLALGYYRGLSFLPDGRLLSVDQDCTVRFWDPVTGKVPREFDLAEGSPVSATPSPDGRLLAVTYHGPGIIDLPTPADFRGLRLVDLTSGQERPTGITDQEPVARLCFSADGRMLATGQYLGGGVVVREVASGRPRWQRKTLPGGDEGLGPEVALSPDGRLLAVPVGEAVHVFDLAVDRVVRSFHGDMAEITCVAFSPDGKTLATGHDLPGVLLWDVRRLYGRLPAVRNVTPEALNLLWADLADTDAGRAFRAVWSLAAVPKHSVPLLRRRLEPGPDGATLRQRTEDWIADLDSRQFPKRRAAFESLRELGRTAEPLLREGLKHGPSPEAKKRLNELLDGLSRELTPEELRTVRAVEVLERCGTAAARRLLKELAGHPDELRRQEARAALTRLTGGPRR
jgi:WD40 repeat protein